MAGLIPATVTLLAIVQYNCDSQEPSKWWQTAIGDAVSDLTGPGIGPQTLLPDNDVFYEYARGRQPTALKEPS